MWTCVYYDPYSYSDSRSCRECGLNPQISVILTRICCTCMLHTYTETLAHGVCPPFWRTAFQSTARVRHRVRVMFSSTIRNGGPKTCTLSFCLIGLFFQSYTGLGYFYVRPVVRYPEIIFIIKFYCCGRTFHRSRAIPVTQPNSVEALKDDSLAC